MVFPHSGALGYADDITLLAPTSPSLKYMLNICHQSADEYDVLLLYFGRLNSGTSVSPVEFNGSVIELVK